MPVRKNVNPMRADVVSDLSALLNALKNTNEAVGEVTFQQQTTGQDWNWEKEQRLRSLRFPGLQLDPRIGRRSLT